MNTLARFGLRATYSSSSYGWHGAIKDAKGKTVWTCNHAHKNRDTSGWTNGASACECAWTELRRRFPVEMAEMSRQSA